MSLILSKAVWKSKTTQGNARLLLLALAEISKDDGTCWPSVGTLREYLNLGTDRAVQQLLSQLEDREFITREMRTGQSTMYRLNVQAIMGGEWSFTPEQVFPHEQPFTPGVNHHSPHPRTAIHPRGEPPFTLTIKEPSKEPSRNHSPEPADPFVPRSQREAKDDAIIAERLKLNPEWEVFARERSEGKQNPEAYGRILLLRWDSGEWTPPTEKKEPSPPMPPAPPLPSEFIAAKPESVSETLWRQHLGLSRRELSKQKAFGEGGYDRTVHAELVIRQALHRLGLDEAQQARAGVTT